MACRIVPSRNSWIRFFPVMSADSPLGNATQRLLQLREQHALLEERIEGFNERIWLSDRERLERKRLQKLKLSIKDQIAALEGNGD